MPYYYFGASLPPLALGSPPPLALDAFREQCREQLGRRDRQALDDLLDGRPAHGRFARAWQASETQLRNALARVRGSRLQRDAGPYLREHDGFDVYAEKAATEAFAQPTPLERERSLDRFRWQQLDELSRNETFSAAAILAYALKLQLAQRWATMDPETGSARMETIVSQRPDEQGRHKQP